MLHPRQILLCAFLALGMAAAGCSVRFGDRRTDDVGAHDAAAEDVAMTEPEPSDCPGEKPDESVGIFVSPSGSSETNCGTIDLPCTSVHLALERAAAVAPGEPSRILYLDNGRYEEALTLTQPITIQGGWTRSDSCWTRESKATRNAGAIIASTGTDLQAIRIDNVADIVLDTLTVRKDGSPVAGQSRFGILVRGTSASLALIDVAVEAGDAGDGAAGQVGATGAPGTGSCAPRSGVAGSMGTEGAVGANGDVSPGQFSSDGFATGDGAPGAVGGKGGPGGISVKACGICDRCEEYPYCDFGPPQEECGGLGTSGCGGDGGAGGLPGGGGGSSVALFVWGAKVNVTDGRLQSGNAGSSGLPGPGGDGGNGSDGAAPAPLACATKCINGPGFCAEQAPTMYLGAAGGKGGRGGPGGVGGAGSAGSSFSYYVGGGGSVVVTGTSLVHGVAGTPRGNGLAGKVADVGP